MCLASPLVRGTSTRLPFSTSVNGSLSKASLAYAVKPLRAQRTIQMRILFCISFRRRRMRSALAFPTHNSPCSLFPIRRPAGDERRTAASSGVPRPETFKCHRGAGERTRSSAALKTKWEFTQIMTFRRLCGSVRGGGGKSDVRRCDGGGHRIGRLRWSCETST